MGFWKSVKKMYSKCFPTSTSTCISKFVDSSNRIAMREINKIIMPFLQDGVEDKGTTFGTAEHCRGRCLTSDSGKAQWSQGDRGERGASIEVSGEADK